jgi:hypothetical protein
MISMRKIMQDKEIESEERVGAILDKWPRKAFLEGSIGAQMWIKRRNDQVRYRKGIFPED